jgi:undecaprenyl-diphosphatase
LSLLEAIVLGIVQGLTEFLPVSSTGHLRIVPAFLGWEDPGAAFTAVTQLGTMTAVLLYFRSDLRRIWHSWLRSLRDRSLVHRDLDARIGWFIVIGTVPIAIFGLVFKDQIETGARDLYLIGSALIVLGLVLLLAEKVSAHERDLEHIRTKDGVVIGLAQALALIPGVSRSGATITAGLFMGLDRATAARFSFLLSVPAVVLSGALELASILNGEEGQHTGLGALAVATLLAFVTGYASIAFLLRYLAHHTTIVFVVYRVALGAVVLVLVASGAIS